MLPEYEPINNNSMETINYGKSFLFDFSIGDFDVKDGKMQEIEGIEALRIWIEKILKTEKYKFKIYETATGTDYGTTLLELINSGHPQVFIQAEIQREIVEALEKNNTILSIDNFNFTRYRRTLIVSFDVYSVYGTTTQEVRF